MKLILRHIFFIVFFLLCLDNTISQVPDSLNVKYQNIPEVYADKDYAEKYETALRRLRRVYPLALHAAREIKSLDKERDLVKAKRKTKRLSRQLNSALKSDFQYVIRDLYIEEGRLLMKLVHRETGMTVSEIIKKYRSSLRGEFQEAVGKIWGQDLNSTYDAKGDDWIVEKVIQDIQKKQVYFVSKAKKLEKKEFKKLKKEYRIDRKKAKKTMRAKRKSGSK